MSSVFAQVLQIVQLLKAHRERRRLEAMQMLPDDSGYEDDMLAGEHQPSRVGKLNGDCASVVGTLSEVATPCIYVTHDPF